ncbi:hypothetical protein OSB04_014764 [Centaurea solstitialis]|uniref:Reverse transcriptase Ty1/copia-type domain-containing protein n=1 Tax=Centaurea solstitialis TaxID=347529 RepID=A0AA38SZA1_9ASTR|nr:hypothetical protein OSB04_014764 [Centaurea solstitialis]
MEDEDVMALVVKLNEGHNRVVFGLSGQKIIGFYLYGLVYDSKNWPYPFPFPVPIQTKGKSRLLTSVSFMLGIANLQMHQMDVKIDLLNEDLEEIYMEQPKGFVAQGKENKVCKLVNTLYGLKQAPKQ